jgi:hypothetical protein
MDTFRRFARATSLPLGFVTLSLIATPAQATGLMILGPQIGQSALFLISSGSLCVNFAYDANGNRLAQTSATVGSSSTLWGAGAFGCFVWDQ